MKIEHKSKDLMVIREKPFISYFISGLFILIPVGILFFAPWQDNPAFLVAPAIIFLLGLIFLLTSKTSVVAIDLQKEMVMTVSKRLVGKQKEDHIALSTIRGIELEKKIQIHNRNRKWLYVLEFKTTEDNNIPFMSKSASTLSINGLQLFDFTKSKLKKIGTEVAEFIGVPFL